MIFWKKSTISKSFKPIAGETKNSLVDEQDARPNLQRNCRSIKFVTKSDWKANRFGLKGIETKPQSKMSKKEQFNDGEIEDLFSKVEIPLEKDKNHIWSEKFESLVKEDVALSSKNFFFRLYWHYGVAASFAILLAATFYFDSQNTVSQEAKLVETLEDSEQDLLADQTMIESLFVEDNEFDEWFEEQYVLSSVN